MFLILLTTVTAVCAEAFSREYLPPVPCCKNTDTTTLVRTLEGTVQDVPSGGYTNDFQGVVVEADSFGSTRIAPSVDSALGRPRDSYGSTNSKVGEAAFKTTFGAFDSKVGPGTRIAPGFESIISGSKDGSNDFKVGEASYKIVPGLTDNNFFKLNAEHGNVEKLDDKKTDEAIFTSNVENNQYTYEYHTGNGIKGGENGVNNNGIQSEGSYSYKGDDGKEYKVTYTADGEGFKPPGNHVSTPPLNGLINRNIEIIKSVEESIRKETAGHYDHGSYDALKYNEGNSENLQHNSSPHLGSIHGSTGAINHNVQFSNSFGKHELNRVNENKLILGLESGLPTINIMNSDGSSSSSLFGVTGETSQSNSHINQHQKYGVTGTTTVTPDSFGNQVTPTKFGAAYTSGSSEQHIGYHYNSPSVTFEAHKLHGFSQFRQQPTQGISSGYVTSKPFEITESIINQGLFNTQQVQDEPNSFLSTTQHKPNTNLNLNFVSHTSQPQRHQSGHNIRPTAVSYTSTPSFTSHINLQPSEELLVTSKYDTSKYHQQAATGTIPVIPVSTLSTYDSSSITQANFTGFNNGRPYKNAQTLDIVKPTNTFITFSPTSNTSMTGSISGYTGYSTNQFSNNLTFSHLNSQDSLSLKPLDKGQPELHQNIKSEISNPQSSQITTQNNLPGSDIEVSKSMPNTSSILSGTSSNLPSPAPPLNYLIEEENLQYKKPLVFDVKPNVQTTSSAFASAFASSGNIKPQTQINDGKYRLTTTKPVSDYSYHYNKPSKPFVIPVASNYGSAQGSQISTSTLQNVKLESAPNKDNLQSTEKKTQNLNSFSSSQTGQIQNTFGNSQFGQTQNSKPVNNQNVIKESGISQSTIGSYNPQVGNTSQSTFGNTQSFKPYNINNQFGSQPGKVNFGQTTLGFSQTTSSQVQPELQPTNSTTSQKSKGQLYEYHKPTVSLISDKQPESNSDKSLGAIQSDKISSQILSDQNSSTGGSVTQQSRFSQTNLGMAVIKNQLQSPPKPVLSGQTISETNINKFGLTQVGTQYEPSTEQQQKTEVVSSTSGKESTFTSGLVTQTSQISSGVVQTGSQFLKPSLSQRTHNLQSNIGIQSVKPSQIGFRKQTFEQSIHKNIPASNTSQTQVVAQPEKETFGQSTLHFGTTQNKYGLTQSGTQTLNLSPGQYQSTGEQYEYKKPNESLTTGKGTNIFNFEANQTGSQGTRVGQTSISSLQSNQAKPLQTGTVSTQTLNTQKVASSAFHSNSPVVKPLFGETNFGTQELKPTFGKIIPTNIQITNNKFGNASAKPQAIQTQFVSQPVKTTVGQSTFSNFHTQFGDQNFKSFAPQTQQSGEFYEYKKPTENSTASKGTNNLTGHVSQIQTQTGQNSVSTIQSSQLQQILQTGSIHSQTLNNSVPKSTYQTNYQSTKSQFSQSNFGTQAFEPTFGQKTTATTTTRLGVAPVKPQISQTQFVSQPAKVSIGQSVFGTTQLGGQQINSSTGYSSQSAGQVSQSKVQLGETKSSTIKSTQSQPVSLQTGAQISNTQNLHTSVYNSQNAKPQFEQINYGSQPSKQIFGQTNTETQIGVTSLKSQDNRTHIVSQAAKATFAQSTEGSLKLKPSLSQSQQTTGEVYQYNKPPNTLNINKESNHENTPQLSSQAQFTTQQDSQTGVIKFGIKPANEFSQSLGTQIGSSQISITKINENSGEYIYNKPTVSFITNKETSNNIHSTNLGKTQSEFNFQHSKPFVGQTLQISDKDETGKSKYQISTSRDKPIADKILQIYEENKSSSTKGIQSLKPGFEHTSIETQLGQTNFGINQNQLEHNKPSLIVDGMESFTTSNTQNSKLNSKLDIEDNKINKTQITTQTKGADSQTIPNALGIQYTQSLASKSHVNLGQNKPILQPTSAKVENSNSQTQSDIQLIKPISCQTSLTDNNQVISQVTGGINNQQTISNFKDDQITLQPVRPILGQNSFGHSENYPLFGYQNQQTTDGQTHDYHHPNFQHQNKYPYPHGNPYHHNLPSLPPSHNFPYRHDYHHHHGHPGSIGPHYQNFGSQFSQRFDKPFNHHDNGHNENNQFGQNNFPFGHVNSDFFNKNPNIPNSLGSKFSNAVSTASVVQSEKNTPDLTLDNLTTQKTSFERIDEAFGSTLSSQSNKPIIANSVTKTESAPSVNVDSTKTQVNGFDNSHISNAATLTNLEALSIKTNGQSYIPFRNPTFHKFSNGTNAGVTAQNAPSFGQESQKVSNAVAQPSTGSSSANFGGNLNHAGPHTSNAVATAQSGGVFGQPNTATATATTGHTHSTFDVSGAKFQPFPTYNGYTSNAAANAIFGPQFGVNPAKASPFSIPSFSNAFASASGGNSFASSFVSSTPVITTVSGHEVDMIKTNVGSKLFSSEFGHVNTIKPAYGTGSLTQISSLGKGEQFGGPRDPPKFDGSTGYHY